jgi:hypothetical protein
MREGEVSENMTPGEAYIMRCLACGFMFRCEVYPEPPIGACDECGDTAVVMYEQAKSDAVALALASREAPSLEIRVWRFEDAPEEYRALSEHGGDEDWVALVPAGLADEYLGWLEKGSAFGYYDVQIARLPDGSEVRIGAHA